MITISTFILGAITSMLLASPSHKFIYKMGYDDGYGAAMDDIFKDED
jgi:hypothetical protein